LRVLEVLTIEGFDLTTDGKKPRVVAPQNLVLSEALNYIYIIIFTICILLLEGFRYVLLDDLEEL
jgi:hypothetical protein